MIQLKSQQTEDRGTVTRIELVGEGLGDNVSKV